MAAEHEHPPINDFNRLGERFVVSHEMNNQSQWVVYRWDPPRGYSPHVIVPAGHDTAEQVREILVHAMPLPCGCTTRPSDRLPDPDYSRNHV